MELLQLIQTVGPFAAIVIFFIYSEVRNRSKETEADSEIKKALAALTTQQQTQSERDSQRIEELSTRIDEQTLININLRERVAAYEGAQRILELTMSDDRDRWEKKEATSEKERSALRAQLGRLELQLEQQQQTINKLEKHNENSKQEIETLTAERDTLRTKNTLLETSNQALTEQINTLKGRRERLVAEAKECGVQIADMQRKLAECQKQEKAEDKPVDTSDDNEEQAA